jgi:hypothetical protein
MLLNGGGDSSAIKLLRNQTVKQNKAWIISMELNDVEGSGGNRKKEQNHMGLVEE